MKLFSLLITGLLFAGLAQAEMRPFVSGSLQKIEREQKGKPFILAFWSASCTHCPAELKALGELVRKYPKLELILVAADTPAEVPELEQLAQGYGVASQARWVFADAQPERLRYEIDRRWYGELPRTYFYDGRQQRKGHSGVLPAEQLEQWVVEHVK
ncbi:MAG: putative signal peptide protein [Proteobacteria bacterium]|nr:putative signal peptide protein [Pseudomonadota bacterium]